MNLTSRQKKYLLKHFKSQSLDGIAKALGVPQKEIEDYLRDRWGKERFRDFIEGQVPQARPVVGSFQLKLFLYNNRFRLLILALAAFLVYANSLGNGYVSDDRGITQNIANGLIYKPKFFLIQSITFLRPLLYFLVANIFGGVPAFYRLINILFHVGATLTIFALISLLSCADIAFFSALIFAVHPLQSEAVSWISGGQYSQYAFFLLLSLLCFALKEKGRKYYVFSLLAFFLSLISSEKAMVLPFILGAYVISFSSLKKDWKSLLPYVGFGAVWIFFYVGKIGQRVDLLQSTYYEKPVRLNPFYQVPVAITEYLKLAFWPKGLTLYHTEMNFTHLAFAFRVFLFLTLLAAIALSFVKNDVLPALKGGVSVFSSREKECAPRVHPRTKDAWYSRFENKPVFFWLSFFVLSLLPVLTPFGISWLVAERYVYLGAVGIYASVVYLVFRIAGRREIGGIGVITGILLTVVVAVLSVGTYLRNRDWQNEDTLWQASAKYSPSSHQNHNNLGDMYSRWGDLEKAAAEFQTAIALKPDYADAYHNLGLTYQKMKNWELAKENYHQAIKFNPNLWQSHMNLANIFFDLGKYEKALAELSSAIEINGQSSDLYTNRGVTLLRLDRDSEARADFEKALELNPQNSRAQEILSSLAK